MKIYQISTGCYSDFDHEILAHEKEYTAEEFADICRAASADVCRVDNYYENRSKIVSQLILNYGFFKPKIAECHFWDYGRIHDGEDDFKYREVNG